MSHYGDLPESAGARAPPPVYYFLSPFAVNQHQHADPRKNPDASFEPVLQAGIALEVLQTDSDVDLAGIFDGMDERAHRDGGDANDDEDGGLLVSEPSAAAAATGWRAGARGGGGAGEGSGRGSAASDEGGGWRTDGAGGGRGDGNGGGDSGGDSGGGSDGNGGGDSGGDSGGGSGSGGGGVHGAADALVAETIGALDVLSAGSLGHGRVCGPGARFDHEYAALAVMSMVERLHGGATRANVMSMVERLHGGATRANRTLAQTQNPENDYAAAGALVTRAQAPLQWAPAFVAGTWQGGDNAAEFFSAALLTEGCRLQELVLDPGIQPAQPSCAQGLTLTRPHPLLLGQQLPSTWDAAAYAAERRGVVLHAERSSPIAPLPWIREGSAVSTPGNGGTSRAASALGGAISAASDRESPHDDTHQPSSSSSSSSSSGAPLLAQPLSGAPLPHAPCAHHDASHGSQGGGSPSGRGLPEHVGRTPSALPGGRTSSGYGRGGLVSAPGGASSPENVGARFGRAPSTLSVGGRSSSGGGGGGHGGSPERPVRRGGGGASPLPRPRQHGVGVGAGRTTTGSAPGAAPGVAAGRRSASVPRASTAASATLAQLSRGDSVAFASGAGSAPLGLTHKRGPCVKRGALSARGGRADAEWTAGGWLTLVDPWSGEAVAARHGEGAAAAACAPPPPPPPRAPVVRDAGVTPGKRQLAMEAALLPPPPVRVSPAGARALASALSDAPSGSLVTLSLSHTRVGSEGVCALLGSLSTNRCLRVLLLRRCGAGHEVGPALAWLAGNTHLQVLDLGDNPTLGPGVVSALAAVLPLTRLRDLRLDGVGCDDEAAIALASALPHAPSLHRLDLSGNACGPSVGVAFASALRQPGVSVQALLLGGNALGSSGALSIAESLLTDGVGCYLQQLILRGNERLGLEVGTGLRDVLARFAPLQCLDVSDNPLFGDVGLVRMAHGLAVNSNLAELRLQSCVLGPSGSRALAEAIGSGAHGLKRLDLSDNPGIGSAGAEALAVYGLGLPGCALVELRMERCGVTAAGRLALAASLQANTRSALRHLHLSGNADPDADPKAGARLAGTKRGDEVANTGLGGGSQQQQQQRPAKAGGAVVVAGIHRSELMLAQALSIGRQLRATRGTIIHG
ncbi:hypothetical protein FOA52_013456 [Chlamydomonas sp. UWO 241]|nr:hypothetical protein FOA52_013456 [Chlamydomonas sp. UWO 241]